MDKASIIFLIPSTTEGVLAEINLLKEYREKTIYIMPPSNYYTSASDQNIESYWSEICVETLKRGLQIPRYRASGALMTFHDDGSLLKYREFGSDFGLIDLATLTSMLETKHITTKNRSCEATI